MARMRIGKKHRRPYGRWLITLLVAGIIGLAAIWGAGSVLPEDQAVIRGVFLKTPNEKVWAALTDYQAMGGWLGVSEVNHLPPRDGYEVWELKQEEGHSMTLLVVQSEAPHMLNLRLLDTPGMAGASWSFELIPQGQGTESGTFVKLSQTGQLRSPLWRFLDHYILGPDLGMRRFLNALGRKFDQKAKIEELIA